MGDGQQPQYVEPAAAEVLQAFLMWFAAEYPIYANWAANRLSQVEALSAPSIPARLS